MMSDLVERLRRTKTEVRMLQMFGGAIACPDGETREVLVNPDGLTAADRIEALESAWETLDRIATESIVETDQPDRIRWKGVWYDGPAATAFLSMLRAIQKMARATLNRSHGDDNG
jgi:hypothetical protein